jgi:hypothetical protein
MLASHTESFLKLIRSTIEDILHGVHSPHHLHNVRCGVENIMCLLEYNNEIVQKADQLSRQACDYITHHDFVASINREGAIVEDAARLDAVREALAGFRFAVTQSKPNSRVRALGLT